MLAFRIVIYLIVLFLIAIVVVAQNHTTAKATLQDAVRRTGRWVCWTFLLLVIMFGLELLFIGW